MEVSGLDLSCTLFESSVTPGSTFWNGGAFGAEGGFSCTIVCSVAILLLLLRKNKKEDVTVHENEGIPLRTENEGDMRSV